MQQVSCAVFCTEVYTAPVASEVGIGLLCSEFAAIGEFFSVETNGQTVVQRCFTGEVDFGVTNDVERTNTVPAPVASSWSTYDR